MASEANSRVLSGFLDYLRIEKGLAPLSISAYTTDICQFSEFLEKRKRLLLTARATMCAIFCSSFFPIRSMAAAWDESSRRCGIFIAICCSIRKSSMIPR